MNASWREPALMLCWNIPDGRPDSDARRPQIAARVVGTAFCASGRVCPAQSGRHKAGAGLGS